ncbi:FG-GAP-like repeat-containing protein [Spirochaetota bacterium]
MKISRLMIFPIILMFVNILVFSSCGNSRKCSSERSLPGRTLIDCGVTGSSFVISNDVDKDGNKDLVVGTYGDFDEGFIGEVIIYYNKGTDIEDISNWRKEKVFGTEENICIGNRVAVHDVDNDGDNDIIVPSGFFLCQDVLFGSQGKWGISWYEQDGGNWIAHDISMKAIDDSNPLFYKSLSMSDVDGDNITDIVTVGALVTGFDTAYDFTENQDNSGRIFGYSNVLVYKGDNSPDRFVKTPIVIGIGGGVLTELFDVDNDNDLDIISPQFFVWDHNDTDVNASFVWFENPGTQDALTSLWSKYPINDNDYGPSIQISAVPNLINGDNKTYAIGTNHTDSSKCVGVAHEAVILFEIPAGDKTTHWINERVLSEDIESPGPSAICGEHGAPGVFHWGDVDGDGDIDIVVSGDGDKRIFVLEQNSTGGFITKVLDANEDVGQAAIVVEDFDNDGVDEIVVSSYDGKTVAIYRYNDVPVLEVSK